MSKPTRFDRNTIGPRQAVRQSGEAWERFTIEGGEGSGQIQELRYCMGVRKPPAKAFGFGGLWAFAANRHLAGRDGEVMLGIYAREDEARKRLGELEAEGWVVVHTTWCGHLWGQGPTANSQ